MGGVAAHFPLRGCSSSWNGVKFCSKDADMAAWKSNLLSVGMICISHVDGAVSCRCDFPLFVLWWTRPSHQLKQKWDLRQLLLIKREWTMSKSEQERSSSAFSALPAFLTSNLSWEEHPLSELLLFLNPSLLSVRQRSLSFAHQPSLLVPFSLS